MRELDKQGPDEQGGVGRAERLQEAEEERSHLIGPVSPLPCPTSRIRQTELDIPQNKTDLETTPIVTPNVTLYKPLYFWSLPALTVKVNNNLERSTEDPGPICEDY